MSEQLLFELNSTGRQGYSLPPMDVPVIPMDELIPKKFQRKTLLRLPELSEARCRASFHTLINSQSPCR